MNCFLEDYLKRETEHYSNNDEQIGEDTETANDLSWREIANVDRYDCHIMPHEDALKDAAAHEYPNIGYLHHSFDNKCCQIDD